jgi:site-specific DNA-methyltransferase (adenine-specific)
MSATATIADVLEGRARWCLIEGDNAEVLPTLPAKSVAHVITDPPYSEHVHSKQRRSLRGSGGLAADGQAAGRGEVCFVPLGFDALSDDSREFCAFEFGRLAQRWCLVFSDQESQHLWRAALEAADVRHVRCGAWIKLCGQPQLSGDRPAVGHEAVQVSHALGRCRWNGGGMPAVWAYQIATDRNGLGERVHTTQKPLDLLLRLVEDFTDPGEVVLDPFAGSGTTGVACLRSGRRFIGIERDPKYAQVARDRLAAESVGLTLRDARAGQQSLFGEVAP